MKIQLKKGKSVSLKSKVLPLLRLPLHRSGDAGTSECYGQEHRVTSPPSFKMEGFHPGEAGLQLFLLCLQRPVAEVEW